MVFNHSHDVQIFNRDLFEILHQSSRYLVKKILSLASDFVVESRNANRRLPTIARSFGFS